VATLVLPRRLAPLSDEALQRFWEHFAMDAVGRVDPVSGLLPQFYEEQYARFKCEYRRRGVQLSLF
jgi:hypothetical protein